MLSRHSNYSSSLAYRLANVFLITPPLYYPTLTPLLILPFTRRHFTLSFGSLVVVSFFPLPFLFACTRFPQLNLYFNLSFPRWCAAFSFPARPPLSRAPLCRRSSARLRQKFPSDASHHRSSSPSLMKLTSQTPVVASVSGRVGVQTMSIKSVVTLLFNH